MRPRVQQHPRLITTADVGHEHTGQGDDGGNTAPDHRPFGVGAEGYLRAVTALLALAVFRLLFLVGHPSSFIQIVDYAGAIISDAGPPQRTHCPARCRLP